MKWWPDISNVNGSPINGPLAKSQGAAAIAAKATEGTGFRDGLLTANYRAAAQAGLPFMAYHFLRHDTSGAAQADFFVSWVDACIGTRKIGWLLDRERDEAGVVPNASVTDAFLGRLAQLLGPGITVTGYEAAWVVAGGGESARMVSNPLIWPSYVGGSGAPGPIISGVTPGYMPAFGGHAAGSYSARQVSSSASIGGIAPCDLNVCYDDAKFAKMFNVSGTLPSPPPKPEPIKDPSGHVLNGPGVGCAITPSGKGYWFVTSDGGVFTHGDAAFKGSAGAEKLPAGKTIIGIAAAPTGAGYWLAGEDGGVFSYGVPFYGSMGGKHINKPIVSIVTSHGGKGYWLVGSDGGIFAFGDATVISNNPLPSQKLNAPIVGAAKTPDGKGLYLTASDGGLFTIGGAMFKGSEGGKHLNAPVVGIAAHSTSTGYWLVASDGGIFSFGSSPFKGSPAGHPLNQPVVGMAASPTGNGYIEVAKDLGVFTYGDAVFKGAGE